MFVEELAAPIRLMSDAPPCSSFSRLLFDAGVAVSTRLQPTAATAIREKLSRRCRHHYLPATALRDGEDSTHKSALAAVKKKRSLQKKNVSSSQRKENESKLIC